MKLFSSMSVLLLAVVSHVKTSQEDIRQPPAITLSSPGHMFFRLDETITLPCAASGTPEPTYEWLKNNGSLNLNAHNIRRDSNGDIRITEAGSLDEAYYQCVVTNQYGKAISNVTFLQRAHQGNPEPAVVTELDVNEGTPFVIRLTPLKSVPKAQYRWASADRTVTATEQDQTDLTRSKRMQWAENGDLYFAYALREDDLRGKIYKGVMFNPVVDLTAGGSYTLVKVKPVQGGVQPFPPALAFSSPNETIGLEGTTINLNCFFNGYPDVAIAWRGPKNNLPVGRFQLLNFNTVLRITSLAQSDSGTYVCEGSNFRGRKDHSIHLDVHAAPVFRHLSDQPQNVNVTEGESVTFPCKAYAKPEADTTWLMNGALLDPRNLPSRVSISSDLHSLTVRSICRDCSDRASLTDLMVIQCNASNRHGYAFGSGYLNVLKRTTVSLVGDTRVTIDDEQQRSHRFQCIGMSDPSTAVRHTWYQLDDNDERSLVYHSPPVVVIDDGMLTITAGENTTSSWKKHRGRYQCVASNGYSIADVITTIEVIEAEPEKGPQAAGILDYWWIFVIIACVFLFFILILICCICLFRNRGNKYDVDFKERKNGNNPEKELVDSGFHDYQRREVEPFKGSQNSLGSSARLFGDDASEVGEHSKFLENGSFHSVPYTNTVDRLRGRSEIV